MATQSTTGITNATSSIAKGMDPNAGNLMGRQESLSEWAGPYVTSMLGKAEALSEQPYQVYGGPLTAAASPLQQQFFQGLGQIGFPSLLGKSFSSAGAPTIPRQQPVLTQGQPQERGRVEDFNRMMAGIPGMPTMPTQTYGGTLGQVAGGAAELIPDAQTPLGQQMLADVKKYASSVNQLSGQAEPSVAATGVTEPVAQGIASQYMNPYLSAVLAPQLSELQRQAQISQMNQAGKLTKAGAFGGSRQAIMDAELQRNLLDQMNRTIGTGYATAYDKAMDQFNKEQAQAMGLAGMLSGAGATQRDIEAQGIAADLAEFQQQRDYPYKMLQFQQSMLQGLPIASVAAQYQQPSTLSSAIQAGGGLMDLYQKFFAPKPTTTTPTQP